MRIPCDYVWFVEPLDSYTNEVFSNEISSEDNLQRDILCTDGLRHNLWQCPLQLLTAFWKSRRAMGLKLRIFNRFKNGKIRECTFLYKKRKTKHASARVLAGKQKQQAKTAP